MGDQGLHGVGNEGYCIKGMNQLYLNKIFN